MYVHMMYMLKTYVHMECILTAYVHAAYINTEYVPVPMAYICTVYVITEYMHNANMSRVCIWHKYNLYVCQI